MNVLGNVCSVVGGIVWLISVSVLGGVCVCRLVVFCVCNVWKCLKRMGEYVSLCRLWCLMVV